MQRTMGILCLAAGLAFAPPAVRGQVEIDSYTFGGLEARSLGPAVMSGRIAAIDAVAEDPLTIYVGTASGGVWKSKDGGLTWKPVFDEHTQSIGAVAIDPKNPQNVWVGTGESCVRNSVSVGDGLYKSTDAGETWQRMGLENSERIAKVRVHPTDGNTVWACVTGHLWDSHEERGIYKTTDGGKTWNRTLFVDADTGCSDLDIDPQDPQILYAGMWQFRRYPWTFYSGGKGSALYKSTDGGATWRKLEKGLPAGEKGRIAVAVSPSRPSVVYAQVEAKKTALYRSDDLGETWREMNSSANIQTRPFYFSHLAVDPTDFNTVYKPGLSLTFSSDGGKSFNNPLSSGFGGGVHGDHHALWINPKNRNELLLGTDGGVYMSYDRARTWRHIRALPVSQFYRISYDMDWPYNVYGGLQDNGSWQGPTRAVSGIQNRHWNNIGMGDGFYAFRDPVDPDLVFVEYQGGQISRLRLSTGENKEIKPMPGTGEPEYRFNWNTPIHLSATPGTLYLGSQFLFRSRDRGDSWEKISPDLTTNDPRKQEQRKSGGLSIDNSTAENHTTIYSIAESPKNGQVIWAGTDDGRLHVTRDAGKSWASLEANVPGVPKNTWVSGIDASPHDEATAFATFDGHATGDMKTYLYKTVDHGKTWAPLGGETLAGAGYAHVVRQDPVNPELLFLGTELGLFVSIDGGAHFARFTGKLPKVAVRDLAIHPRESDLLIASHGRGVYVVDDITPLRKLTREILEADAALLPSRPSPMVLPASIQNFSGDDEFTAANPEEAAVIVYYLKKRHVVGDLKVEVWNAQGEKMATLPAGKRKGINRVAWPMRLPPPKLPPANSLVLSQFSMFGPRVQPGTYTVKLIQGDKTYTGQVELVPEPRSRHSAEDRTLQHETAMTLYGMLGRLTYLADAAAGLATQARERAAKLPAGDRLRPQLEKLAADLDAYNATLAATSEGGWLSGEEQLRERMSTLYGGVNGYEGRPSQSQLDQVKVMAAELDQAASRLDALQAGGVAAVNRELEKRKLEPLRVKSREEWEQEAGKRTGAAPGMLPVVKVF